MNRFDRERCGQRWGMSGRRNETASARASRRGVLAASAALGLGLLTGACGRADVASDANGEGVGVDPSSPSPSGSPRPELPRGGRELFPRFRLMGYCGYPGALALGRLGTGDPEQRADEIEQKAAGYAGGREVLPVLELLASVANPTAGPDGLYRTRTPADVIGDFHAVARRHRDMLLLNIQPGRAAMLDEVKALEKWLVQPDVGVALDPEWDMGPGEVPGQKFGHTDGSEITAVADYLSGLVAQHDLPEKPLVFHQVADFVVPDRAKLRSAPGVALIMSADGIGSPPLKRATWEILVKHLPEEVHTGFKLFYEEDTAGGGRLMAPKEVLALKPEPEYVMYE
jgi:hypothetical protein